LAFVMLVGVTIAVARMRSDMASYALDSAASRAHHVIQ
jgi:hypothetical protein